MTIHTREIFYLGKGGTGKTTISAMTAIALAESNYRVAIVSMDPAHNLFDVFQVHPEHNHFNINENLRLEEIDPEFWLKKYLQTIEQQVSRSYQYLTALSLEKNLHLLRYAPGLEEYALLYAYRAVREKFSAYDFLILDMPPTALSLRFFSLPLLSQVWLSQLINIRKTILQKTKIIEDIHRQDSDVIPDKILKTLLHMHDDNEQLQMQFCDRTKSLMYIVLNNDPLSLAESEDIQKKFNNMGLIVEGYILNKATIEENRENKAGKLNLPPVAARLSVFSEYLLGQEALKGFASTPDFRKFISDLINKKSDASPKTGVL